MKMLTVVAVICTIMALTRAADLAEVKPENDQPAETDLVKRTFWCSRGWTRISGRCFRYVPRPMSWAQAERNCLAMGGNLASVRSYWEYIKIQRVIIYACHRNRETWIGGSDAQQEKVWLWSNGRPFKYQRWCRGEPNNYKGKQHCLQMNHSAGKCWDDDNCYKRKPSVCVKRTW